ncbi:11531_t:CDS:10 [Diversispora eburnea]|uniref:11531_t:CDS:1 n=1 Tax=Diversispora eburnea TaxID=1213867 RepID=A0A9N9ANE1_9GLOM|nr:11531_t:CDS:10 [Diversispora eburnea]
MSGSFFGFDTTMPPLKSDQLAGLDSNGVSTHHDETEEEELERKIKDFALESEEEFEDFGYEQNFDLGTKLEESGDDMNDETFGVVVDVGKYFDFTESNTKIVDTIQKEEEIYIGRKENSSPDNNADENNNRRPSYAALWGNNSDIIVNGKNNHSNDIPNLSESPISPSIWGSFHSSSSNRKDSITLPQEVPNISGTFENNQQYTPPPPLNTSPPPGFGPSRQPNPPHPSASLEQIEAQLHRQAGISEKRMLSLAEVEAALLGGVNGRPPPPMYPSAETVFREQENGVFLEQEAALLKQEALMIQRERKRRDKQRKLAEMSKYNGLMTQNDKEFINRIQISQLVTDDPYADDFYYQVYTAIRTRQPNPQIFSPQIGGAGFMGQERGRHRSRGSESGSLKMQQQVLRIVNDARRKPKMTQLSLEGALGKIALNSVRNPRQLLQVSSKNTDLHHHAGPNSNGGFHHQHQKIPSISSHGVIDHRKVLRSIENVYSVVLSLEELRRNQPPLPRPYFDHEREAFDKWNEEYSEYAKTMWEELRVTEMIGVSYPHPFISILSVAKGKKVIPRVLRHCLPEQTLTLITMLVANFESLDVCKGAVWGTQENVGSRMLEEVELFMNTVVPPLLQFVAEAPLRIVLGLFGLFIERNNIVWVARSKVGLAFLTMFLSRAEILKQGGGTIQELYNRLFSILQNHFLSLFPPFLNGIDDMYVWQFLAAMAVGASTEQQHILVTEVRERVLETVLQASRLSADKKSHKIANVNLFLNALGLDASQLKI